MRALVVHPGPGFSVADVYAGWVDGLEACGVQVASCALDEHRNVLAAAHSKRGGRWEPLFRPEAVEHEAAKAIEVACYEWWPQLVVIVSAFFVPQFVIDIVRSRGHHVVVHFTESPYQDGQQIAQAPWFDTVLVNDPVHLDRFKAANARSFYAPHCYRPAIHHPGPGRPEMACDVSFTGTGYPSRIGFLEAVDWDGVDVRLAGNWEALVPGSPLDRFLLANRRDCLPNDVTADLYRSTKVGFNLYRVEASEGDHAEGVAVGPREVEMAACGTFFLRQPRAEGDGLWPHLPTFTTADELGDLARWWSLDRNESRRRRAADRAGEAITDRTFEALAAQLLASLDRRPTALTA